MEKILIKYIPKDIIRYNIVPFLMISEEDVIKNKNKVVLFIPHNPIEKIKWYNKIIAEEDCNNAPLSYGVDGLTCLRWGMKKKIMGPSVSSSKFTRREQNKNGKIKYSYRDKKLIKIYQEITDLFKIVSRNGEMWDPYE